MSHHAAIHAEGLRKTLGARAVLCGVDLHVITGECVILRGGNGSGKTTLLRCLAGLVRPEAGSVRWLGHSPQETASRLLIGMAAHESQLYPHLTLRENLVFIGRLYRVSGATARASRWLESAGLNEHADRLPREVSEGQRRRASLARALIHDPPILLLDESFSGLDHTGRSWLCDLLRERRSQERTTLLVTHERELARHLVDRYVELRSGRLWPSAGPPAEREIDVRDPANVSSRSRREEVVTR